MQTFEVHALPVEMESVSNVTATNSVNLGETRVFRGEEYLYVYNAGTGSIAVGQFAVLSANSGYSVTVSSITSFDYPMGFAKHAAIPAGSYGWLITRGFTSVNFASNTGGALSDLLYPGAFGNVASLGKVTASLTCSIVYQPIGYLVSAAATIGTATQTSGLAYVRCYGT
jgi:hypothetical protein